MGVAPAVWDPRNFPYTVFPLGKCEPVWVIGIDEFDDPEPVVVVTTWPVAAVTIGEGLEWGRGREE